MVQPPWCDVVEPDPNVPRERPDHPAPTRSNRNAEEHQQVPLAVPATKNRKTVSACQDGSTNSYPSRLALTKGEGIYTSWESGERTSVDGTMN